MRIATLSSRVDGRILHAGQASCAHITDMPSFRPNGVGRFATGARPPCRACACRGPGRAGSVPHAEEPEHVGEMGFTVLSRRPSVVAICRFDCPLYDKPQDVALAPGQVDLRPVRTGKDVGISARG